MRTIASRRAVWLGLGTAALGLAAAAGLAADTSPLPHPLVTLGRDPAVQGDLGLSAGQAAAVARAVAQVDLPLWQLRDVAPAERGDKVEPLVRAFRSRLDEALRAPQRERLEQILFRAEGVPAFVRPANAERLHLTAEQKAAIQKVLDETQASLAELARQGKSDAAQPEKLRAAEQKKVLALLDRKQQAELAQAVGKPFDVGRIRYLACQAPELRGIDAWVNSEPLTLAQLRGKVVALHFYAFGCINCIHNFPHYKAWHADLAGKGLVVLGVHTPETQAERDMDAVRRRAKEAGLAFPIAVDAKGETWNAWANRMWPSVYLIDKQGHVRRWWYGELNWQGAEGEKLLRQKIEELLAEKE